MSIITAKDFLQELCTETFDPTATENAYVNGGIINIGANGNVTINNGKTETAVGTLNQGAANYDVLTEEKQAIAAKTANMNRLTAEIASLTK